MITTTVPTSPPHTTLASLHGSGNLSMPQDMCVAVTKTAMTAATATTKTSSSSATAAAAECPTTTPAFGQLVADLRAALGPDAGLDSSDVDVKAIEERMRAYAASDGGWAPYALGDASRGYTRNLVDEGNGKSNLLVLVWSPGKGSPVHDHASAHCVMKVLKGSLAETQYAWPRPGDDKQMQVIKKTVLGTDQVTYMSDDLGLHKIINPDPNDFAVSLHLYSPPHAATHGCSLFDPKTGKARHVPPTTYFSVQGSRM